MKNENKIVGAEKAPKSFSPEQGHKEFELTAAAYHEAGHVAAYAFFDNGFSHITRVRIWHDANGESRGRVSRELVFAYHVYHQFDILPPQTKAIHARVNAICSLAGPVAEAKFKCLNTEAEGAEEEEDLEGDVLYDLGEGMMRCWLPDGSWALATEIPGADLYIVNWYAEQVERKYHPVKSLFRKWTRVAVELMDRPDVWRCVSKFAEHLVKVREVAGRDLEPYFKEIRGASDKSKKWRNPDLIKTVDVLRSWGSNDPMADGVKDKL